MRKLRIQNAMYAANQPKRQRKNVPQVISAHDEEIALLGRKFSIMVRLWVVNVDAFKAPRPAFHADSANRYESDISVEQGLAAELHDFIPRKFHEMMLNHSHFGLHVCTYATSHLPTY
jgi:hypothetical protein